jgi:hypothetical protein
VKNKILAMAMAMVDGDNDDDYLNHKMDFDNSIISVATSRCDLRVFWWGKRVHSTTLCCLIPVLAHSYLSFFHRCRICLIRRIHMSRVCCS